jgi:hypothetical protein
MLAGRAVRATARSEFDLAAVEVFFEFRPLHRGERRVFVSGSLCPSAGEELLVVAHQVLLDDEERIARAAYPRTVPGLHPMASAISASDMSA